MAGRRVNVNVGVLGHIDSGKTALARALSTTASTAAFDKQPQSRERGITLDLGFSCFSVPLPAHLRPAPGAGPEPEPEPRLQVTPQDCSRPLQTHASTRDSWTLMGKSGSVPRGVTAPFSWVLVHTRFCFCPPRVCFPILCKFCN